MKAITDTYPGWARRPWLHTGQPGAAARSATVAIHSWPFGLQIHHIFLFDPALTCCGVRALLRAGRHRANGLGWVVTRTVCPANTCLLEQTGQPLPLARSLILASHSWPFGQIHHALFSDPAVTCCGARVPLRAECH